MTINDSMLFIAAELHKQTKPTKQPARRNRSVIHCQSKRCDCSRVQLSTADMPATAA